MTTGASLVEAARTIGDQVRTVPAAAVVAFRPKG
jgi:hypothetical protein